MNKFINQAEGIIKEVCGREAVKELKILLDDCKKAGFTVAEVDSARNMMLFMLLMERTGKVKIEGEKNGD